jgi:hypothetical protein
LALAAVAVGKTNTLGGEFSKGDGSVNPNATIEMKVKTNAKGKPKSVSGIEGQNLTYRCIESGVSGEHDFVVPGSFKVQKDTTVDPPTMYFADTVTDATGEEFQVFGELLNKKGTKVEGEVLVSFGTPPEFCGNSVGGYTASK